MECPTCATAPQPGGYTRPARAAQSALQPIFCHGYKKAELRNEHGAFFSPKPRRLFFGNEQLGAGGKETSAAETCPPARVRDTATH